MRIVLIIATIGSFMFTSCSKSDQFIEDFQDNWSLILKTGQFPNTCNFPINEIIWTISESNIDIQNNADETLYCNPKNLDNGEYSITESNGKYYLEFNNYNVGLINIEGDNMTIDGNKGPDFENADAVIYTFSRN